MTKQAKVGVILGSASDSAVADKVFAVLKGLSVEVEAAVASAHRTPKRVRRFVELAEAQGVTVWIAIAGMAAALPGVVAAETLFPVIGLPVQSGALGGVDALLAIAQMPPGVPTATVSVNGGENAALLAARILALNNPTLAARLADHAKAQAEKVRATHLKLHYSTLI